jgi:AraC family transcriptional regulator
MNKTGGQGTRDRLSKLVANSLDAQVKTQDLARQAYQSRTHFHRLFRTVVEETPASMRRRLLLERAAYQLGHSGMSVTEVAFNANSALSFAHLQQDSLSWPWFLNRRRKRHGFIRSLCRQ